MLRGRGRRAGRRLRPRDAVGGKRDAARKWQRGRRQRLEPSVIMLGTRVCVYIYKYMFYVHV